MDDMPKPSKELVRAFKTFLNGRDCLILLGIILLGIWVRLAFIEQIIRFDEAQTFNLYVSQAPGELFHMSQLNNHLFHSLLVWVTTLFAGTEP